MMGACLQFFAMKEESDSQWTVAQDDRGQQVDASRFRWTVEPDFDDGRPKATTIHRSDLVL